MSNPLITVIVPIYKAESYLKRCVDSIRNQTYSDLEIILVDDGSPDRSGEMCDAYAEQDSRIRVFHEKNGGQSSARNIGLDNMTGEYVAFVDSDDWIEKDTYQHLYDLIIRYDAQIACCGIQKVFADGTRSYFNSQYPNNSQICVYSTAEALGESLNNEKITYSPCDKLYHKSIFSNLRMTVGKIYEDMEIIPKSIECAQRIVYDPIPLYHYVMTEESTIRGTFNPRRFAEADVAREKMEDYRVRFPELYDKAVGKYISICLEIIHISKGVESCADRRKAMIIEMSGKISSSAVKCMRKNERIKLMLLRISPILFECVMRLYDKIK